MLIYEIKKNGKWEAVRCESMGKLNTYCEENGYVDWRTLGMRSRREMVNDKKIKII